MEPTLYRDVPPDALLGGIAVCGSVKNYRKYCRQESKDARARFAAMNASQGTGASLQLSTIYPENAEEVIESAVTEIARKPLGVTAELLAENLVTPLPNWWAVPSLRRGRIGQAGRAHRSMIPDSRGERFVLERDGVSWPIFCTWANFDFSIRELAIGQRMGAPLDVSHSEWATYLVQEANEDQAINGLTGPQGESLTIDGMSAPGLLGTSTTFTYADWNTLTGAQIVDLVQTQIEVLRQTHRNMPFTLLVPSNYSKKLTSQYTTLFKGTILSFLEELGPWGGRKLKVVLVDTLPNDRVVLFASDKRVVDLVVGQQTIPVSWKDGPGWNTYWVVLNCVIFRMFADKNGDYGVAAGNLA